MTVDIDFDNLNIQQKGLFRRSFPSEVTVMSKASIIIKPTNSTNWFNSTSCLLKAVGGIYFNYNIGELDSVFMDILSFNFDDKPQNPKTPRPVSILRICKLNIYISIG